MHISTECVSKLVDEHRVTLPADILLRYVAQQCLIGKRIVAAAVAARQIDQPDEIRWLAVLRDGQHEKASVVAHCAAEHLLRCGRCCADAEIARRIGAHSMIVHTLILILIGLCSSTLTFL